MKYVEVSDNSQDTQTALHHSPSNIITPVLLHKPATASSQSSLQEKTALHPPCAPLSF